MLYATSSIASLFQLIATTLPSVNSSTSIKLIISDVTLNLNIMLVVLGGVFFGKSQPNPIVNLGVGIGTKPPGFIVGYFNYGYYR